MSGAQEGLWWTEARRGALRRAMAEGNETARFLEAQTRERAVPGDDMERDGRGLESRAALAWLEDDAPLANSVAREWAAFCAEGPKSNLGEAGWALTGAAIVDTVYGLLEPETRRLTAEALWNLVARLRMPGRGNPHVVTNNWWAVTHGGALCAALTAERLAGADAPGFDPDAAEWALGRLRAFCHHFGPTGLYHEGLGYIRYTCMFLFPAIMAARSRGLGDLLEAFPNLRNTLPSLYAAVALREYEDDTLAAGSNFGASLCWNDMGTGAGVTCLDSIGLAIAPPPLRPALKGWFDKLTGPRSPRPSLGGHHACVPLAWAFLPLEDGGDVFRALPREVTDSRQGLLFWRDRYQDAGDVVFGLYAKPTHAGGHSHQDAGSLRMEAFGTDWIAGPGQARTRREGQSVAFPAAGELPGANLGAVNFQKTLPDGLLAGMELRKVSGCYHERLVALKHRPGEPLPLACMIADLVDDHQDRDWCWNWTYSRELEARLDEDGGGVRLCRKDGLAVWIRFLEAKPRSLTLGELPESRRTYAGGRAESYRGKPFVSAVFAPEKHLAMVVAAVWGPLDSLPRPEGGIHGLSAGGDMCWARPFGAAIPSAFRPGISAGPSQASPVQDAAHLC